MKKYLLIMISLTSFLFFSCASKKSIEDQIADSVAEKIESEIDAAMAEAAEFQNETEISTNNTEEQQQPEQTSEETNSDEEALTAENTDSSENMDSTISELIAEQLETIEEPEVITLEPEDEVVALESDEIEDVSSVEPELVEIDNEEKAIIEAEPETQFQEQEQEQDLEPTDILADSELEETEEVPIEVIIEPSRSVTLNKFEYLDITYPGSGWIFMGLTDGSKDLTYFGRKVGTENTKFSLQAKNPGTKILHFYKNDALTNSIIDDYIEVIVTSEKGSNKTHVEAPDYKVPVPKKNSVNESVEKETPSAEPETSLKTEKAIPAPASVPAVATPAPAPAPVPAAKPVTAETSEPAPKSVAKSEEKNTIKLPPKKEADEVIDITDEVEEVSEPIIDTDALLKEIKELVKSKSFYKANDKLKIFFEHASKHLDEGLYLQGQIYEAKGELQNINKAIESYTMLTKNYPASKFWDDANKRIIYLKRFYLEGR